MGMIGEVFIIICKIYKRVCSVFKLFAWKIIYGKALKVGIGTFFYPGTHVLIEKNGNIVIGNNCFFNNNCSLNSMKKIEIGDDCIFGENVCMYDHNHQYKDLSKIIRKQDFNIEEIHVGNNCWIGSNVTILKGVKIGDNVIIGAGVVLTKSVPSNSIVIDRGDMEIRNIKREE